MLPLLAALSLPAAAQDLSVSGACPGPIDVEVTGVTPGGRAALLYSALGEGFDVLPGGPCRDIAVDLLGVRYANTLTDFDGDGVVRTRPTLGPRACGASVQAIDLTTCETTDLGVVGLSVDADVRGLLLSEWTVPQVHEFDPATGATVPYHDAELNDVDCNASMGSPLAWYVEHRSDDIGTFVPGSGAGVDAIEPDTDYDYPKHVAVYNDEVLVMSRNDCIVRRYDFEAGPRGDFDADCTSGQGLATDGAHLFVSTWGPGEIREYDSDFVLVDTHAFPSGMAGDNLVDLAYDPRTRTWWGMDTTGEAGTGTNTTTLVEFEMGGSVLRSVELPIAVDGVGLLACP